MSKLRLAQCVLHSCIRSHKMSWLLMEQGHDVHLITERPLDAHGWVDFNSCNLIYTGQLDWREYFPDQLFSTIQTLTRVVDLFHFHNEPDWPMEIIRQACEKKPIIYDIHDMVSQRSGEIDEQEKKAWAEADGFVVPSEEYQKIVEERTCKPVVCVKSCVPEKLFPTQRRTPSRRGLVYEGGLKGKPKEQSDQFEFRSWAQVFKELSKLNVETWAYPSSSQEDFSEYQSSGTIMMPSFAYGELLKNLTAHEAGLVGSPFPNGAFNGALPNKLFEYISAGIPVISINAPTVARFLKETGLGLSVEDIYQIPDAIEQLRKDQTRDKVWEERKNWTMEKQLPPLLEMYQRVLNNYYFLTS